MWPTVYAITSTWVKDKFTHLKSLALSVSDSFFMGGNSAMTFKSARNSLSTSHMYELELYAFNSIFVFHLQDDNITTTWMELFSEFLWIIYIRTVIPRLSCTCLVGTSMLTSSYTAWYRYLCACCEVNEFSIDLCWNGCKVKRSVDKLQNMLDPQHLKKFPTSGSYTDCANL